MVDSPAGSDCTTTLNSESFWTINVEGVPESERQAILFFRAIQRKMKGEARSDNNKKHRCCSSAPAASSRILYTVVNKTKL